MKNNLLLIASVSFLALTSCTKDTKNDPSISDASLSSMATSQDGFVLMRTTTANDNSEWKIKMNDVAAKAYANGSRNFPANSMIVKEKHNVAGKISGYDVMFKSPADNNSSDGWLCTGLDENGKVIYSTTERAVSCNSCHAASGKLTLH